MAIADRCTALGTPAAWADEFWPEFEHQVLSALGAAWSRLRALGIDQGWSENMIVARLLAPLDDVIRERGLPIFPQDETRLLNATPTRRGRGRAVANGTDAQPNNPDRAPRIDLAIRHHGMTRSMYFGVEAKILTDIATGWRTLSDSTAAYIADGVARYATHSYALGLPTAAMLGFILQGSVDTVADAIRARLVAEGVSLTPLDVIEGIDWHGGSEHERGDGTFRLHHLLASCAPPTT